MTLLKRKPWVYSLPLPMGESLPLDKV